ncbi:hypothetical protein HK100_010903, partial [Physocladia obscura]
MIKKQLSQPANASKIRETHDKSVSEKSPDSTVASAQPLTKSAEVEQEEEAKFDRVHAKVWNPNNPESWEADMRGYHAVEESEYTLPSDEIEQSRLETQHYLLR